MKRYIRAFATATILTAESDEYYCNVEVSGKTYTVSVCPRYSDGMCGFPIRETRYTDESKAIRTFRRYVKEFDLVENKESYYYTHKF